MELKKNILFGNQCLSSYLCSGKQRTCKRRRWHFAGNNLTVQSSSDSCRTAVYLDEYHKAADYAGFCQTLSAGSCQSVSTMAVHTNLQMDVFSS